MTAGAPPSADFAVCRLPNQLGRIGTRPTALFAASRVTARKQTPERSAIELTEHRTLRTGRTCWRSVDDATPSDQLPTNLVDVAIVGAGVMGVMLAERLSSDGRSVVVLDRRAPAQGSTAGSTALVMWAADVPLTRLAETLGAEEAARRWRRVHRAARELADKIDCEAIDCGRIDRPELYLEGALLDGEGLCAEGAARRAAGLPSEFLDAEAVAARFDIAARPALLSSDSYEVDPLRLTWALLKRARAQGASACFPHNVERIKQAEDAITLYLDGGDTLRCAQLVLATGYERPTLLLPAAFSVGSSYAIASPPGLAPQWRENALIWEASESYTYARATADGRIIAGGADEQFDDAQQRDALIAAKSGILQAQLATLTAGSPISLDCAWASAFGHSPDGLPAIGRAAGRERMWLASGFGGNGVTFAALAAGLIAADLAGAPDPDAACFDPYRFG